MSQEKGGPVRGGRQQTARLTGFVQEGGADGAARTVWKAREAVELLG